VAKFEVIDGKTLESDDFNHRTMAGKRSFFRYISNELGVKTGRSAIWFRFLEFKKEHPTPKN
jgi:hypothetical protein